jgi:hypothetical protein
MMISKKLRVVWHRIEKTLFWIWPPYESLVTDREIKKLRNQESDDARWETVQSSVRELLPDQTERLEELEMYSLQISKAENDRFNIVDNKAATFIAGIGIATSLISLGPVVLASKRTLHNTPLAWFAFIVYVLAIVYFLAAVYFAVKVRRVNAFVSDSADTFIEALRKNHASTSERIVFNISAAKWNEMMMTNKTNYLSVVESLVIA